MKKLMCFLIIFLVLSGCAKKEEPVNLATDTGPLVREEYMSDEEKELKMIQGVIRDYNEDKIEDRREYFQIRIPSLPIGITSLPEIDSLNDLKEIPVDPGITNAVYAGQYPISDTVSAVFRIYHPTKDMFWLNGDVSFETDPESVEVNAPAFAEYKSVLDSLFSRQNSILNWLYGIDVSLGKEMEPGYYEVLNMGGNTPPASIDEIRGMAEQVFTYEFLNDNYYPTCFNSANPVYKMIDDTLCCVITELPSPPVTEFSTDHIINAEKTENGVRIDLLSKVLDTVQPEIYEIILTETPDGYRLPSAY